MPDPSGHSILIVDDEPEILETTKWAFETSGYTVFTARTGEEAIELLQNTPPDVLLIDFKLPKMSGIEFLKEAKALHPTVAAIMITGLTHQTEEVEKECQGLGTCAFLRKPLKMEEVLEVVAHAIQQKP